MCSHWRTGRRLRQRARRAGRCRVPHSEMTDVEIRPIKSESEITSKINQWAAETYPVAQKLLDTAKTLETPTKRPSTH